MIKSIDTNEFLDSEDDVQVTRTEKVKDFLITHKSTIIKVSLSAVAIFGGAMILNSRVKPETVYFGHNVKVHDWDKLDNGDRMFIFGADSINDVENIKDVLKENAKVDDATSLYGYIFTDEKEM